MAPLKSVKNKTQASSLLQFHFLLCIGEKMPKIAEIIVDRLISLEVKRVYGVAGDSLSQIVGFNLWMMRARHERPRRRGRRTCNDKPPSRFLGEVCLYPAKGLHPLQTPRRGFFYLFL
jgi:hypothetical protein